MLKRKEDRVWNVEKPEQVAAFVAFAKLDGAKKSVVVRYGEGLGGITVMESVATKADTTAAATASSKAAERDSIQIPTAKIGSAQGMALGTALGSVVSFTRNGVRYVVIGSVTQQDALAAARGL